MKKIIDDSGFNKLIKGRDGYFLYNTNDIYVGKSLEKYGEYNSQESSLFEIICHKSDFIIDAGANIGTHTVSFANIVGQDGRVYAFEPQRIVFQNLCANIALNSLTNVECFQLALGEEEGKVLIPPINYTVTGNFGGIGKDIFGTGEAVPLRSIDEFLDIPKLKLIKIDVEGMEEEVIRGAKNTINKFRPFLYVENDRRDKSPALIKLVMSLGYKLYWHTPYLYNENNFAADRENIFAETFSLNILCIPEEMNVTVEGPVEITDPNQFPVIKETESA